MPRPDVGIVVDLGALTPPYVQIFDQIRAMIERGDVRPGELLPPVRQLAGDLGLAPNTVARAYADLKAEHWIEGEQRRPTRVARNATTRVARTRRSMLQDAVAGFVATLTSRGYAVDEIAAELGRRLNMSTR